MSSSGETYQTKICTILLTIIFSILFLIIIPVIIIFLIPFYVYRWIISSKFLLSKLRPDLHKILSGHSTFYATSSNDEDKTTKTPVWANILLYMKIKGKLNLNKMISKLVSVGYAKKDNDKMLYPEFHTYCISWMGYLFWKWEDGDDTIKISNHISNTKLLDEFKNDDEYIINFSNNFLKTPFKPNQSPWEVIFLENESNTTEEDEDEDNWYIVLFKFHHSLADGCSIFNVMMNCVDEPVKMTLPRNINYNGRCLQKMVHILTFPFKAAYDFNYVSLENIKYKSPWNIIPNDMSCTRDFIDSKIISIDMLKNASDIFGVSISAVVIAALSGGIGRFLKNHGNGIPPEAIMCQMPVPIPNHPEGLTNSFSLVSLKLPIGSENLNERLKLSEKTIIEAKSSLYSTVAFLLGKLLGSALPQGILKRISNKIQPLQLSIFPGPRTLVTFDNQPVLNMSYTVYGAKYIPVVLTLLSYNNGIQIILNVDDNLFPPQTRLLKHLIEEIEQEFDRSCQHVIQIVQQK